MSMYKYCQSVYKRICDSDLIKGFISSSLWGGLTKAIGVLITIYCTNHLSQEGFGEFSFIRNTLDTIIVICATNFSTLAVKFAAESINNDDSLRRLYLLFGFTIAISFVVALFFLLIPKEVLESFTGGHHVAFYMRVAGLCLPVFIVQPLISSIFRGCKKFNLVGIYEFANYIVFFVFVIIGIRFYDYQGAILAVLLYLAVFTISGIFILYYFNKEVNCIRKVEGIHNQRKSLYNMIFPIFLMSFVEAPLLWLAQAEIGRKESYSVVGCLSVILTIRYMIQIIPTYFYQSFIPHATIQNSEGRYYEYFRRYKQISMFLFYILLFLSIVLLLTGKYILCCFGSEYVHSYKSFVLSILIMPLLLYSTLFKVNMMIREHQVSMFYMTIISSCCFLLFFYGFSFLNFNLLDGFFYAQAIQFGYQLLHSLKVYYSDKKYCFKLIEDNVR